MTSPEDNDLSTLRTENAALRRRVQELEEGRAGSSFYETLFDHLLVPLIVYRPDGLAIATNRNNLAFIGVSREKIVGHHNILHDPEARARGYTAAFERAARGEIVKTPPAPYNPSRGNLGEPEDRTVWSEAIYFPIHGPEGVTYVVAVNRDVSAQQRAERALRESDTLVRAIADNSPLLLFVKDIEGRYTLVNRRCGEIGRFAVEDVLGKTDAEFFPKHVAEMHRAGDEALLAGNKVIEEEEIFPGPNGPRNLLSTKFPVRDADGKLQGICGIKVDITELRRAEAENLRLQEEMLRVHEETLRALSTPLIPIADGVVAMPLIGAVDRERAQRVMAAMLEGVAARRAKVAILDVTGVPVADDEVASALLRVARAVRLLGAEVVLTGIRPEVAQALISIGVELGYVVTLSTLQDGIAYALRR